jgi:hypothetical protein
MNCLKMLPIVLVVLSIICLMCVAVYCWRCITYSETLEYTLYEIDDGVFGYYNLVTSSIPSQNYEVITLYFGGGMYTLKGHVSIHYTDETPKLIWERTKLVNGDSMAVYIPKGSLEIRQNVTVGK